MMVAMSVTRALTISTVVQITGKVVSTLLGIVVISLMTRLLGTEGFGSYSTANAFLQVFILLADVGINVTFPAILGEHAHNPAYQQRVFTAVLTLRLLMTGVILLVIAPIVAFTWPFPWVIKLAILALSLSFAFPSVQQIMVGVQQQKLRMNAVAISENVGRLINIAGLLLAPMFGWGVVAQCAIISVGSGAVFLINVLSVRRFVPLVWNWDPTIWRMVLTRSWPVGLSIGLNLIYYKADALVLQFFRPQSEVGIYGAAYRLLEVLISIPFLYAGVLLPVLSKTWAEKRHEDLSALISRSLDLMILLILPLVIGMQWFGERVLVAISGPAFLAAGSIAKILVFGVAAIYLNTVLSHAVVALQAQKKMLPLYGFVAFGTLAGYLLFIPVYGAIAAAWLTVLSETLILLGSIVTVRQHVHFMPSLRIVGGAVFSGALMWYVGSATASFGLFSSLFLTSGTYLLVLAATRTITPAIVRTLLTKSTP